MPASFKHTVPTAGMGQETEAQCWFASYKMLLKFHGRNTDEVKDKLNASLGMVRTDAGPKLSGWDDAMANGLTDTDYKKCADALGLQGWPGREFNQEPSWYDVGLSDGAENFLSKLQAGPLWVSRRSGSINHIVLVTGYNDDLEVVTFNNPFHNKKDAIEQTRNVNKFVRLITGAACSVQTKK